MNLLVILLAFIFNSTHAYNGFHSDPFSSPPLKLNSTILSYGDVALTWLQKYVLEYGNIGYNAVRGINHRWKDATIPYNIHCSLEHLSNAYKAIHKAMDQWERKTCIRFVQHTNEKNFVTFYRDTQCWGNIGQMSQPRVSVGPGCEKENVMAHEIGHVIGLFHEHNRPDRDEWIKLQTQNIGYHAEAFNIVMNSDSYGVPYDYESIMHYPWAAFSVNGKATMLPRKETDGKVPYQSISKDDVKLVSRMYNCPDKSIPNQNIDKRGEVWKDVWPNRHYLGVGILCKNHYDKCDAWAKAGDCKRSSNFMFRRCSAACKKLKFDIECDLGLKQLPWECSDPLGLAKTKDDSITRLPDSAFSATTELITGIWTAPASSARLYNEDEYDSKRIGSWCTDNQLPNQYVQVDLQTERTITYIATQGRPFFFERVSKFKIQFSATKSEAFQTYQEDGHEKIFYGNCDHQSPVLNRFKNPIVARFIRYIPVKWNYPCVRIELFGC